ncbi:MAG: hypothetical protein VCD33_16890 [Alphaproteobacteria bacterium]|jgi:Na+-transporting methylmalonyl-CoA/oxaloacetate decarboxylase gamma subunit
MAVTELHKRRLGRNLAVAGVLMVLVVLFFAITIVKFGGAS